MKVGIVSPWFERGCAYVALAMYEALAAEHEVHVLARGGTPEPQGKEWDVPNVTRASAGSFARPLGWAQERGLDVVVFNERRDCARLLPLREAGMALVSLQEWEWLAPGTVPAMNRCFHVVIAPTVCAYDRFREMGLERVFHVPWGVDLEAFHPADEKDGAVRFFHPAGWGGVGERRATRAVWQAFAKADADATLTITTQRGVGVERKGNATTLRGTMPREILARHYRRADVAVLPSKWEGLGLTFLEALASGLAILTVDAPPMNEYVADGRNGHLCKVRMADPPKGKGVQVQQALVDVDDLARRMEEMAADQERTWEMGRNSRARAERFHDWRANGRFLLEAVDVAKRMSEQGS